VKDLIVFNDPAGNRLEIFHGAETTTDPFKPGRNISGFRTGPARHGPCGDAFRAHRRRDGFYQDVLEFKVSDYWLRPFPAYFFHVNPRHHSIAFVESGINMVHHMMVELYSFDDVGQGYDLALGDPERIGVTLGRHSGDYVTSFYTWNPSGFLVEYGWGGQVIDDNSWSRSNANSARACGAMNAAGCRRRRKRSRVCSASRRRRTASASRYR
jgi:hypothetical protein